MAKQFADISPAHREFIQRQKLFFVASAAPEGRVNLSPKGFDALRVLSPTSVAYLDLTGSGNETAAHLLAEGPSQGRLTIVFCAFEGAPLILRLYGRGEVLPRGSVAYAELLATHFAGEEPAGARHVIRLEIDLVQSSCGFGVPLFSYQEERPTLIRWAEAKGEDGLRIYRREKNMSSLDGLPTGLNEPI